MLVFDANLTSAGRRGGGRGRTWWRQRRAFLVIQTHPETIKSRQTSLKISSQDIRPFSTSRDPVSQDLHCPKFEPKMQGPYLIGRKTDILPTHPLPPDEHQHCKYLSLATRSALAMQARKYATTGGASHNEILCSKQQFTQQGQ